VEEEKKKKEEEGEEEEKKKKKKLSLSACGPAQHTDGIATCYRLDGPGIESRWGKIFLTPPEWHWGPSGLQHPI
jgi:hypothetical protein